MKGLLRLAPAVLAGFMAHVVVPRAALVAHDHAGGTTPHVHLWVWSEDGQGPEHDGDAHHHSHTHPHDAGHAPTLAALRHVHVSQPFQHACRPAPPALCRVDRVLIAAPRIPPTPPAAALPVARSRGPPLVVA